MRERVEGERGGIAVEGVKMRCLRREDTFSERRRLNLDWRTSAFI